MPNDPKPQDSRDTDEAELADEALEGVSGGALPAGRGNRGVAVGRFYVELNSNNSGYLKKLGD